MFDIATCNKAIRGSNLISALSELGDLATLIVTASPVGNLNVYRQKSDSVMEWLGWIDLNGEYFESIDPGDERDIPLGWRH